MSQNFDIAIIGGSFAGMTSALTLLQKMPNLEIAIIEQQNLIEEEKKRDGRSYAISSASLKLFKEIGIYEELQEFAGKISDIKITDYKSPFYLDFFGKEVDEENSQLGQIIENFYIFNSLRAKVLANKNITIFAPNSYEEISFNENGTEIILDNKKVINAKISLACDGKFSKIREKFQIHKTIKKYYQTAITFSIRHQKPHQNIAYEKFLAGGPLAILPLHNHNESSIVWIAKDDLASAILELDEENFKQQLLKKMENCLGEVEIISDKFPYQLTLIESDKFYYEKILLIGDASCSVHPIAGQGFNLAIGNIKVLAELISKNNGVLDQELIFSYNKKAKISAQKMAIATDILNSIFETKNLPISLARNIGLGFLNKAPKLKKFFIKSAGGF